MSKVHHEFLELFFFCVCPFFFLALNRLGIITSPNAGGSKSKVYNEFANHLKGFNFDPAQGSQVCTVHRIVMDRWFRADWLDRYAPIPLVVGWVRKKNNPTNKDFLLPPRYIFFDNHVNKIS